MIAEKGIHPRGKALRNVTVAETFAHGGAVLGCDLGVTPKTAQSQWLGETTDDEIANQTMLQPE